MVHCLGNTGFISSLGPKNVEEASLCQHERGKPTSRKRAVKNHSLAKEFPLPLTFILPLWYVNDWLIWESLLCFKLKTLAAPQWRLLWKSRQYLVERSGDRRLVSQREVQAVRIIENKYATKEINRFLEFFSFLISCFLMNFYCWATVSFWILLSCFSSPSHSFQALIINFG